MDSRGGIPSGGSHTPPERDPGPGPGAAMAFTVDLGDEEGSPATSDGKTSKNLSDCLPPKLRKSFRKRTEKVKEKQKEREEEKVKDLPFSCNNNLQCL